MSLNWDFLNLITEINSLPPKWKVESLKYVIRNFVSGGTPESGKHENWTELNDGIAWVTISDMTRSYFIKYTDKKITAQGLNEKRLKILPPGTLLYSIYASLGCVAILEIPATTNQAILGLIPSKRVQSQYLRYWLESVKIYLDALASSNTQDNLNIEKVRNIPILLPPLSEQKAIVNYLDKETAKIDQLIEAKKRLLELLDEKRRALITYAVTRGLNPDVPMRDSGVEWIGEIPKHWEILPLRRILKKMDYGISESVGSEGNIAVLRMGDIDEGEICYDNVGFVDDVDHDLILTANDLLFNRTNSLDKIGKVAIFRNNYSFPVSFASYLVRMRCNDSVIPEYLNYLLNSSPVLTWAKSNALPAIGQVNLNPNRYSYVNIPIPPIEEQLNIKKYIYTKIKQIEKLCFSSKETIKLLQERRVSLITAAVTGQIKIT